LFPCSSSRHRVRQAVEGGGLHQTHTLPGIACYLRCSGMNSRCGCRQNGLLVSLFYFLSSFTAFLLRLILSIPESYTRLSYIPGRTFYNSRSDDPSPRSVLGWSSDLECPGDRQDRNKPTPLGMRPLHGVCRRYPRYACSLFIMDASWLCQRQLTR
jgi:hypothetical protein